MIFFFYFYLRSRSGLMEVQWTSFPIDMPLSYMTWVKERRDHSRFPHISRESRFWNLLLRESALTPQRWFNWQVCKMGTFAKIFAASVCVAFLAVKWTRPSFDAGKRDATARLQISIAVNIRRMIFCVWWHSSSKHAGVTMWWQVVMSWWNVTKYIITST